MRIITRMLKQKAAYWENTGESDEFNRPIYTPPIEIRCRWEDMTEEILDNQGRTILTRSRAYVEVDILEGGVLMLLPKIDGVQTTLANLTNPTAPFSNVVGRDFRAWEVKRFDKFPTLKATQFLRTAFM